jgi:hypothetical protein
MIAMLHKPFLRRMWFRSTFCFGYSKIEPFEKAEHPFQVFKGCSVSVG